MKKKYIKPIVEQTECVQSTDLLQASYHYHAEGKNSGIWDDEQDSETDGTLNRNLWDD